MNLKKLIKLADSKSIQTASLLLTARKLTVVNSISLLEVDHGLETFLSNDECIILDKSLVSRLGDGPLKINRDPKNYTINDIQIKPEKINNCSFLPKETRARLWPNQILPFTITVNAAQLQALQAAIGSKTIDITLDVASPGNALLIASESARGLLMPINKKHKDQEELKGKLVYNPK